MFDPWDDNADNRKYPNMNLIILFALFDSIPD
jgi:hypothetical protein